MQDDKSEASQSEENQTDMGVENQVDTGDQKPRENKTVDVEEQPDQPETKKSTETLSKSGLQQKLATWQKAYLLHKKITIPATVLALLLVILAVPATRYKVLGLFIKKEVLIYTINDKTKGAIYNPYVTLDGKEPFCGADRPPYPNCFAKVPVGKHKLKVQAGLYETVEMEITVGLGKSKKQNIEVRMKATGSQIHTRVVDKITGRALSNVRLKAGDSETETTENGGYVFVDFSADSTQLEVSREGYNTLKTSVKIVPGQAEQENVEIALTPKGKVYFLSKRTGKINVMKSDLDGANPEVVLAATGNEQDGDTILLASQDWRYLALKAKRGNTKPSLYLIDTSNGDKLTTIDEGDAAFTLTGWSGHTFVYQVQREKVQLWQPNRQSIKSYNAETGKLNVLDNTAGEGSGNSTYGGTDYRSEYQGNIILVGNTVVYSKYWISGVYTYNNSTLSGKQNGIYSVSVDGQNKKLVKGFDATTSTSIEGKLYEPGEVYFRTYVNGKVEFYELEGGALQPKGDLTGQFDALYPTYLFSPSNNNTFWAESRDGKSTLFIGDSKGENSKAVLELSEYAAYGWYTDKYLLLSKNSSELYVMSAETGATQPPLKITDYHKPDTIFYGYGGGYGGL